MEIGQVDRVTEEKVGVVVPVPLTEVAVTAGPGGRR